MKKTVIFEFPDDFEFPEYFGQKNTVEEVLRRGVFTGSILETKFRMKSTCVYCPFNVAGGGYGEESECYLTGDTEDKAEDKRHKCPFYGGADTVNYNDY